MITCPFGCGNAVPLSFLSERVHCHPEMHASVLEKFGSELMERVYHAVRCPNPHCDCHLRSSAASPAILECACGEEVCAVCKEESHFPAPCTLARVATALVQDGDFANSEWIRSNTRPCPKCEVSIEKNNGCNHMRCARCRHEFCWTCGVAWGPHQE